MRHAIFLVGGPGSGKDIILRNVPHLTEYTEYKIEQLKSNILESKILVTGNSYNLDNIQNAKDLLESLYYKTSMIFVDVSDSVSHSRMSLRIIDESVRHEKLKISKMNLETFKQIFENFHYFNNNYDSKSPLIRMQLESLDKNITINEELPEVKFKNRLKKIACEKQPKTNGMREVPWNPSIPSKDGIGQTYDTRAAGNGDLVRNYESLDPAPVMDSGIGFGSTYGNTFKQDTIDATHGSSVRPIDRTKNRTNFQKDKEVEKELKTPTFSKVKRIVFKREEK